MSDSDIGEKAVMRHDEVATEKSARNHNGPASKDDERGQKKTKQELIEEIDARATAPGVTRESFNHIDEKKLLRKMDLRLLPILTLLYLLSFIDRGNIGNAKIEGLAEDLKLTGGQYNLCLTAFFLIYCAAEPPSNIILKRIRPSIRLPSIMVAWGLVMTLMGLCQSYAGLLTARCFLGLTEAGLFPGCVFYLTMWYTRYEYQWRMALFFSAVGIAGAFSGLLAYGISFMRGVGGLNAWRWIFILEGIVTVLVAIAAFFIVHDFPETATFLTEEERAFVVWRLKFQSQPDTADQGAEVAQNYEFSWKAIGDAFKDVQVYAGIVMFWAIELKETIRCLCPLTNKGMKVIVAPLYGIALFLPTIIKGLGYKTTTAQLLTVPIYAFASAMAVLFAWLSDRAGKRTPFILPLMFVILVGFIMCTSSSKPGVVYAGIFIAAAGVYGAYPGNIALISNNLAGSSKRAAGMAIHIAGGNLSGAMASNFYRAKDSPRYVLGHGLEISFVCLGIGAVSLLMFNYTRINKRRARQLAAGEHATYTAKELSDLGDRAITFRCML